MIDVVPLSIATPDAVEHLLDATFGSDRHGRTAYALRDGLKPIGHLSFAAFENDALVGSIQCWPVRIGTGYEPGTALIMVGPVAVSPDRQNIGIGKRLMAAALDAADTAISPALMMIGDPEYYGQFGFHADLTAGWQLPGPWEAHRLLARNIHKHSLPKHGMLEPDHQYAL